jgi:hypothetical protein
MNLTGGFDAGKSAGLPVATPDPDREYLKTCSRNQAANYQERKVPAGRRNRNIASHWLADAWHAKADVDAMGAVLARATGASRDDAEGHLLARATELLSRA